METKSCEIQKSNENQDENISIEGKKTVLGNIENTKADSTSCPLLEKDVAPAEEALVDDCLKTETRSSKSSSPDLDLSDIKPVSVEDSSYNIMSVCSTAAQHIRQTITEVLNSRLDGSSSSVTIEEIPSSLEESLKQKLEDFENTVKSNISQSAHEPESAALEISHNAASVKNEDISQQKEAPAPSGSFVQNDEGPNPVASERKSSSESTDSSTTADAVNNTSQKCKSSDKPSGNKELSNNDVKITSVGVKCNGRVDQTTNENRVPVDSHHTDEKYSKKSSRNSNSKKKGERSVDYILKSLASLSSTEEKLQALGRKHSETLDDLKSAESRLKQNEKQVIQLVKEKEQLQGEHNRMILAKSKLESLCRELQRQNKAVKEESLLRIREEEEKRKEVASKFQTTLNEISNLMQENSKKNLQLKEENAELAQKLKTLVEHYEMWEKHMEKVVQQKDLEAQLAKAKHAKTNLQLKQETEKFLKEKQSLLENMSELQKKCTQLATNELQLRAELNDYTSKYEEFQTVLNKSNQVFATFKTDMETTSKKIKKLEKETNVWKQKWESSNNALLEMITDKQKRDKELLNARQRILTLEKLCRALQTERNDLQNQLTGKQQPNHQATDGGTCEVTVGSKDAC